MKAVGTPAAAGQPALAAQLLDPASVAAQATTVADRLARPVGRTDPQDALAEEVLRDRAKVLAALARALRHESRDGDEPQDGYDVGSYRDVADVLDRAVADADVDITGRPGVPAPSASTPASSRGRYSDPRRFAEASLTTALNTVIGSVEQLARELYRLRAAVPTLHDPDNPRRPLHRGGPYQQVKVSPSRHWGALAGAGAAGTFGPASGGLVPPRG